MLEDQDKQKKEGTENLPTNMALTLSSYKGKMYQAFSGYGYSYKLCCKKLQNYKSTKM